MKRDEEIQKIGVKIQTLIDKLKDYNCSIDSSYSSIGIFDDEILPEMDEDYPREIKSHQNQIVFSFNTSRVK